MKPVVDALTSGTAAGRSAVPTEAEVRRIHTRSVRVLVAAQAVGAVGVTIGVATSSLLARDLSGSDALAGLAQTAGVVGSALAAFGLARLMATRGRRVGQVTGLLVGALGAVLCVVAGARGSMALLLFGSVLLGSVSAANSAARYAATDLAVANQRARSLSLVVWATTVGAVLGPNLVGPSGRVAESLGLPELTGAYLFGAVAMLLAAAVVGFLLRPDPLLTARALATGTQPSAGATGAPGGSTRSGGAAPDTRKLGVDEANVWQVLASRPPLVAAVVAMACAHVVMVSVMIMTPLHMEHGGSQLEVIGLVVSLHVFGMFAFSPLVGLAADRWGRTVTLFVGAAVLMVALVLCASSPTGTSPQIATGLFLLGVGWSFATVSASTLVVDHSPLAHRTQVQGFGDVTMWLAAAGGGALAGGIVEGWGYATLAVAAAVVCCGVVAAGLVLARAEARTG